jgi:hypothetical protein
VTFAPDSHNKLSSHCPARESYAICLALLACTWLTGCEAPPPPKAFSFLSFKYSRTCSGCPDLTDQNESAAYYRSIGISDAAFDPVKGVITSSFTFNTWLGNNGFPYGFPTNGLHTVPYAIYANKFDLAAARDANCEQSGPNIACYVILYSQKGEPWSNGPNPLWLDDHFSFRFLNFVLSDAIGANNGSPLSTSVPFAITALVSGPNTGAPNNVAFYTFDPDGNLMGVEALDGEGPKTVPRMCMTCHGGTYDTVTHSVTGASFMPFDVWSFQQSNIHPYTFDDQHERFRRINAIVAATNPNPAILDFLNATYPCPPNKQCVDSSGVVTPGVSGVYTPGVMAVDFDPLTYNDWIANPNIYGSFVKPYCRSCHLAQPPNAPSFTTYREFQIFTGLIQSNVCGPAHTMPQSEVPFLSFWVNDKVAQKDLGDFMKSQGQANCP